MARHYAPKNFLRHTANWLLDRYFRDRGVLPDLDITSLGETKVDDIFEGWQSLAPEERLAIDTDFQEIDALAHEPGVQTLLEEAQFHGLDLAPAFAELDGFHDEAMLAFLDHPEVFWVAARFNEADMRSKRYWRRRKGVPRRSPSDDETGCKRLASGLTEYLRRSEGRGYLCVVEVYRRDRRHYFFASPEDYGETYLEFEEEQLERRKRRRAFQIVFVYTKEAGTLDVFFEGSRQKARDLQEIFARTILGQELPPLPGDDRVFELNKLKRRAFEFRYSPASGIRDVRIKKMRFTAIGEPKERWTLEVDPGVRRDAIWDAMEKTFQADGAATSSCSKMPLSLVNVTQVGMTVEFDSDGRRRRTRTFDVTFPNTCPLDHEGRDGAIRQMLVESGIEPRYLDDAASA